MSNPSGLTARELSIALYQLPAGALVEIASDASLNNVGAISTTDEGGLHVFDARHRETGEQVIVLWSGEWECWEDRYD